MRYAIAGLFALLIVAGGYAYYLHMERSIKAFIRSQFEAEGSVPPEVAAVLDSEKPPKHPFLAYTRGPIPEHVFSMIKVVENLRAYSVFLIVFVCGISFGIAHWMSPKVPQQETQS